MRTRAFYPLVRGTSEAAKDKITMLFAIGRAAGGQNDTAIVWPIQEITKRQTKDKKPLIPWVSRYLLIRAANSAFSSKE